MQVISIFCSRYKHDLPGHDSHTPLQNQILVITEMIVVVVLGIRLAYALTMDVVPDA